MGRRNNKGTKTWSEEEVEILKIEYFKGTPVQKIQSMMPNHTLISVYAKANSLGLKAGGKYSRYTEEEDSWLVENYPDHSIKDVAAHLNRSTHSVRGRAGKLKLTEPYYKFAFAKLTRGKMKAMIRNAGLRNWVFTVEPEYLWKRYIRQKKKCYLTGRLMPDINKASLDRVDNTKGYVRGNVEWCISEANMMKFTHSLSNFIDLCTSVAENHNG